MTSTNIEVVGFFSPTNSDALLLEVGTCGSFESRYPKLAPYIGFASQEDRLILNDTDYRENIKFHFSGTSIQDDTEGGNESFSFSTLDVTYVDGIRYILVWLTPSSAFENVWGESTRSFPMSYKALTSEALKWGIRIWEDKDPYNNPDPRGISRNPEGDDNARFCLVQFDEEREMISLDVHIYMKSLVESAKTSDTGNSFLTDLTYLSKSWGVSVPPTAHIKPYNFFCFL